MDTTTGLTLEEQKVAEQIDRYFLSSRMTYREKLFHALLIAQHDLEAHHFSSEDERQRILKYIMVLQGMLSKVSNCEKQA